MHLANSYQGGSFRNFQQISYPSNNALQPFSIHLLFFEHTPSSNNDLTKGHCLPEYWQADIKAAVSEGLSESQAHWQVKKFRDYWQAKSGKEALKVD
ncbi:hypothetical protein [Bartonella sp. OT172YNZD]|uniref:hypothetical protein n=1 Tax=Bartonella sp. OT172YNZD TaxID=3243572 RepID=UPI0035CFEF04